MASLAEAVQALPAELYNEVYELTFTAPTNLVVNIDSMYKPPVQLRISRSLREQFAKSYYGGNTIFYLPKRLVVNWSGSLTLQHSQLLNEVRIIWGEYHTYQDGRRTRFVVSKWLHQSYYRCGWYHHTRSKQNIKFKVVFDEPDDRRWMSCMEPGFDVWSLRNESALSWHHEKKARGE